MDKILIENELIKKAQNGDLQAENEILTTYSPLVKSIARSFYVIGEDEDLIQMGMIGLMRAVRTYNADSSAAFKTYASHCIRNTITDAVRKQNALPDSDSLDGLLLPSDEQEPERIFIEGETSQLLFDAISSVLNERELSVLRLFLDAMSYAEISEKLGMEKKQVDNTIYALRKKIKKILKDAHSEN
ncbi:MAG: sigma-70 family RNA polymerase sigma factor [Clostridia bacterium]|nr:sigma-70 family RNA polymerase sigma factor [Clostridia bacterium]